MPWWRNGEIPIDNTSFQNIILELVFKCPVCTRHEIKDGIKENGKPKKKTVYKAVSARNSSFHLRGISGNALTTVLAQIRKPLMRAGSYFVLPVNGDVAATAQSIIKSSELSDKNFEIMVFQTRNDMPDTEAIFYYLRNAFAHGSFEINTKERMYFIECRKDEVVKAQMRLKESTLLYYVDLAKAGLVDIRKMQRIRKK